MGSNAQKLVYVSKLQFLMTVKILNQDGNTGNSALKDVKLTQNANSGPCPGTVDSVIVKIEYIANSLQKEMILIDLLINLSQYFIVESEIASGLNPLLQKL